MPLRPLDETGKPLRPGLCTLHLDLTADGEKTSMALETFAISVPARVYRLPETATSTETVTEPVEVTVSAEETLSTTNSLITLAGFSLEQTRFVSGATIPLTLFWQTDGLIETSYTVFVQMLDENGRLITQQDQIPANGNRPTTGWVPGEFVEDRHALVLPVDVAPGHYQIITGFYDAETGERLRLADSSGDAITIPLSIEVKTAE
ncbi:MAG: hypothetical protein M5U34_42885 [Chloroflexi bacterium]|nr:hypothetical protein [Chloroflexota bacterium]